MMTPPRLYAIADHDTLLRHAVPMQAFAESLAAAGTHLVQLRDKSGSPRQILAQAAILKAALPAATLLMNDRTDLAKLAGFSGVHVGQEDLAPADVRVIAPPGFVIGVSTHQLDQVVIADAGPADYIAVGPIFATGTKPDASPVVGLDFIRRARELTARPIVAIGGITRQNARSVIDAGADSIAVISALFAPGETVEQTARDFLDILR